MSAPSPTPAPTPEAAAAAMLQSMKFQLDPAINWRLEKMFPQLTGWGAKGNVKRQAKLAKQAEPMLVKVLASGEQVLFVAKGIRYSFAEQYFMGIWAQMINHTVFVLTNARLLMLHSNGKGKPRDTAWMIYYSEIENFKSSWTGMVDVKLKDGSKMRFSGFAKHDRKIMPDLFKEALAEYREAGFSPQTSQSCENLCYNCFEAVPKDSYRCEACSAEFWQPSQIALRSLMFPSWGDIIMKHYGLAAVELIGYLIGWAIVVNILLNEVDPVGRFLPLVLFLLFSHGVDSALSYYVAKKGLHLKKVSAA
jgi:hypothetical protein